MKKLLTLAAFGVAVFAYQDCAMCHSGGMAKKLDTMTPAQIEAKMNEMKKTGKGNPMMVPIAKSMSDKDIVDSAKKYGKK